MKFRIHRFSGTIICFNDKELGFEITSDKTSQGIFHHWSNITFPEDWIDL